MTPRKPKVQVSEFPRESCGTCTFCGLAPDEKSDMLFCWVNEPQFLYVDEMENNIWHRGVPVQNPRLPACKKFEPRMHA